MPRPPDDRLVTTVEAAKIIGRSRSAIWRWIDAGLLRTYKRPRDRLTYVDREALAEAARRVGPPGPRPRESRRPPAEG